MRKAFDVVITVVVSFIVSMFLNVASNLFSQPRGFIEFGEPIAIQKKTYLPINITNYKKTELNNILLAAPKYIDPNQIASSQPIDIKTKTASVGSEHIQHLTILGVKSKGSLELLIPLKDLRDCHSVKPINSNDLNLEVIDFANRDSRFSGVLKEALTTSIFYSLIFGAFVLYFEIRREESRANIEKIGKQSEVISAELKQTRGTLARLKIFLLKQISDYSKELDFWRDTIRKVLYKSKGNEECEQLISAITEGLKTYSTKSKTSVDFDVIEQILKGTHPDNKP